VINLNTTIYDVQFKYAQLYCHDSEELLKGKGKYVQTINGHKIDRCMKLSKFEDTLNEWRNL
jgi:hypothetical protein